MTFAVTGSEIRRKARSAEWNTMVFYSFTRHRSSYAPAVNKMPSFCATAKKYDVFSFEVHSDLLNFTETVMYLTWDL